MKKFIVTSMFLSMVFVLGCGSGEKVSWETQEAARQQALDNSEHNANLFRNANYPHLLIRLRGDSTIGPDCKTGDGWASVDLYSEDKSQLLELKCSTVSPTIGCMPKDDFQKRAQYASQEGTCNHEIPFPLPKVKK